jgi:hypothetical protein
MEQQVLRNNSIPEPVEYMTEVEMNETHELELDIAVKYCVEYAKQEAFCINNENRVRMKKIIDDNKTKDEVNVEDVEMDWKEVEANQKEVKLKVINWLVSEKRI